ncbi:MAG: hypothetical protein AABY22_20430 [Nanoarchaeota archaeon]
MKVKELKKLLEDVPDEVDIFLQLNTNDYYTPKFPLVRNLINISYGFDSSNNLSMVTLSDE